MKKYLRLTCTLCRRDIDKLVDITHYTPDRCTITQGCEGRLQPVEYRSSAGIAISPEVGVKDWQPRVTRATKSSTVTSTHLITTPSLVNLETGTLKQLVIAVPGDERGSVSITLEGKADTPKAYRSYIFRKEEIFSTVSGVESGLEKKTLRYGESDMVEVYINGVKREPGAGPNDYQIAGSGSVAPNTISFNSPIDESGITQIDVIVSKEEPTSSYTLVFKRNKYDESRASTGAYENVSYVEMLRAGKWEKLYLYTLDLDIVSAAIPVNTILIPKENMDVMFLLAARPYTQIDRSSTSALVLSGLTAERDYIKYYADDSNITARATVESLVNIFPPLRFGKFNVEKTIKVYTSGVEEQIVIDGKVITGPDS